MSDDSETPRQATCVALGGYAVLIEGASGLGKSSLALQLIDRGAMLIGDDGVILRRGDDRLIAAPHPHTRGLLEVRNLGLIEFPVCDCAPVALLIRLDKDAPRFIEQAECIQICGVNVPMIRLWPKNPVNALKAELALRQFGYLR